MRSGTGSGTRVRLGALCLSVLMAFAAFGTSPANAELLHPRQQWLRDSQIGLFLHWGMRTSPAYTDCAAWEQAVTEGGWTADYWVNEAIKLHVKYLVFASFHSRLGYARAWPSAIPGSCSTQRDFLRELNDAAKAKGLRVILYMTDDPQWYWEGLPPGESWFDSAAYSAYKGKAVDLTTRDGFGEFSYDNFVEVMQNYPDLAGFWIDNDNAYWERNGLYERIRAERPDWLLSNNNEDTPIMDTVSNEEKTGMTPDYDYPAAVWTPQPRLTEADFRIAGHWWYTGSNPSVNYPFAIRRIITNVGSSIKALVAEGAQHNGRFPANLEAFNNYMAGYLDRIWESIEGTEGGGYMYGGLQPGWLNDGAFAVTTVKKSNPDLHYVHVTTRPAVGSMVRLRDNGYKVLEVSNLRTGELMRFNQSGGYLSILGISGWDPYDTVFKVETDGRQFIYPQHTIRATASASDAAFPAGNLVDGDYLTYWDNDATLPASITLDLGAPKPARYLGVNQREWSVSYRRSATEDSARIRDYRVFASNDGVNWGNPIRTGTLASARGVRFVDIGENVARYLRLEVLSTWAAPSATRFYRELRVDELFVGHRYPYNAENPLPYEAEAAGNTLSGTARVVQCWACSGVAKVTGIGGSAENFVTVNNVEVEQSGDYRLTIQYTVEGTRSFFVSANGGPGVEVPVSGTTGEVPETATVAVRLDTGANTIRFYNDGAAAPDLDRISVSPLPPPSYEAEASGNTFSGAARVGSCAGCSGGAKVRFIGNGASNYLVVNGVEVAVAGMYRMTIYSTVDGTRSFFVSVNGGPGIEVPVTGTSWDIPTTTTITVPLNAGTNSVKFYNDNAYAPDLDRITIDR